MSLYSRHKPFECEYWFSAHCTSVLFMTSWARGGARARGLSLQHVGPFSPHRLTLLSLGVGQKRLLYSCIVSDMYCLLLRWFFFFDILIKGIINNYLLPCLPLIKKIIIMKLFIKSKTILFNVNSCLGQPVFTSCAFFFLCTFSFVHTHMRW